MSQSPFGDPPAANPYQSPAAMPAGAEGAGFGAAGVTPRSIQLLAATRPWVRFLSVVGFVIAGLTVLGGLFAVAFGLSQGQFEMVGAAVVYVLIALLYFFGALHLGRYASHISILETNASIQSLEDALAAQKTFWRFVGILFAVVMAISAVLIVLGIVIGLAALVFRS